MTKWATIIIGLTFFSCITEEIEPEVLVSKLDGAEYVADMKGEMNARKATHLILQGKQDSVNYIYRRAISDSLQTQDSTWRRKYFEALNILLPELDSLERRYLGVNAFSYFLHNPNELLVQLNVTAFDNSEFWLRILSVEFNSRVLPEDITINSVINLAHKYCDNCSDEEKESIIEFVETLSVYED
jgi:hypothetical protein|tara:strand:- start:730 stop:1287 length:558 start_codon:yes stop_codon:yes gene_type:complete